MLISYAQNYEDVMLWRALRHVGTGSYIDVGANDPVIDSVTHLFYQLGWRGINIEPLRCHFEDLQRERPDDVNLLCAAGAFEGEIELLDFNVRGWATVDQSAIAAHRARGDKGVPFTVPITTLSAICLQHAPPEIQFLKIDVEGYEAAVLQGMDFARFRPWIVVVEATRPNSTVPMHTQWEHWLIGANYQFVYADGLNRFYLAAEHREMAHAFAFPPNVFDDFVKAPQKAAEDRAKQAETLAADAVAARTQAEWRLGHWQLQAEHAERRAQQAEHRAEQAEHRAQQAEHRAYQADLHAGHLQLQARDAEERATQSAFAAAQAHLRVSTLLESTSWRITAPMRRLTGALYATSHPLKGTLRAGIRWLGTHVRTRPKLKASLLAMLAPFPSLSWRLRTASLGPIPIQDRPSSEPSPGPRDPLPPRIRHICEALTNEMAKRKDERF